MILLLNEEKRDLGTIPSLDNIDTEELSEALERDILEVDITARSAIDEESKNGFEITIYDAEGGIAGYLRSIEL